MKLRYQLRGLGVGIIITAIIMGVAGKDGLPLSDAEIRQRAMELGMVDGGNRKLTDLQGADGEDESASVPDEGPESGPGESSAPEPPGSESGGSSAPEGPESGSGDLSAPEPPDSESGGSSAPEGPESESGDSSAPDAGGNAEASSVPDGEPEYGEASGQGGNLGSGEGESREGSLAADGGTDDEGESGPSDVEAGTENVQAPDAERVSLVIEPGITSEQVCILLAEAGLVGDAYRLDRYLCENGYSTSIRHGAYEIAAGTSEEEIIRIITGGRAGQVRGTVE